MGVLRIVFLLSFLLTIHPTPVFADMGPKPSVNIAVTLEGKDLPDKKFQARMLACMDTESEFGSFFQDDEAPEPLRLSIPDESGSCVWMPYSLAWGGDCSYNACDFSYMPPTKFRLAVFLPSQNKTFISSPVTRENFHSSFSMNMLSDGTAEIRETTSFWNQDGILPAMIRAVVLTIVIEVFLAALVIPFTRTPKSVLLTVAWGSAVTVPALWGLLLIAKTVPSVFLFAYLFGEIGVILFEAWLLHRRHPQHISRKKSLIFSFIFNAASWVFGVQFLWNILQ